MKQQGRFNPQFDAYQAAAADFAKPIMAHLRKLVHEACPQVVEEIKWGIPHFDYQGEMLCIFAAYKSHCSFSFWQQSLMSDARLKANADQRVAWIADAKTDQTRQKRIDEALEWIAQGKGRFWKYEKK